MSQPPRAIILGLSIAGSLSALTLLQRTNFSVTIYELRSVPATVGGGLNLAPNAVRQLHRLGCDVEHLGAPIPTVLLQNAKGQRLTVVACGGRENTFATPYTARRVMRKDLLSAMLAALKPYEEAGRMKTFFSKKATAIEESVKNATIQFDDGTSDTGDIIVGADGIHSWTRTYMQTHMYDTPSEKLSTVKYTGLAALYAVVDASDLPKPAVELFHEHPMIVTSSQSAGALVASVASNPLKQIVWFASFAPQTPPSPDAPAPNPDELRKNATATYGRYPSPYPELIAATKSFAYWPVYRLDPLPQAWASPKGRVVLLGDAAHAMPPHAAQGVGMSVEDSILIAKILEAVDASGSWGNLSAELWRREYQDRRLPRTQKFKAIAEKRGEDRQPRGWFANEAREWATWLAGPLVNQLSRRRDIQGWGYEVDNELVRVP